LVIVLAGLKNMLIRHTFIIVNCFHGLSFWLSERSSTLLMLAGLHTLRHCVDAHLSAIS